MNIPSEKQASGLRKYFIEYAVLFLVSSVIVLFYLYISLSKQVMEIQTNVIQQNTEALHIFNSKLSR